MEPLLESSEVSTFMGALNRIFARICNEYFNKSGISFVLPLKLGKNIEIRGPLSFGVAGKASRHTRSFESTIDTASPRSSPFPPNHHEFFFFLRLFSSLPLFSAPLSSLNVATRDGNPHVRMPCARASALSTYTRLAHAHDVGGFHTNPPKTTTSSNFPHGDSSYLATYNPPRVYPKHSTRRKSFGTCARASSVRTRFN